MKAIFASFVTVGCIFAATALPAQAWYCRAEGTTGAYGWGTSYYNNSARNIALRECAVRTPRYARCYIMYCRRN